ncbi:MAG: GrpB family protein [Candidatus Bathyarchaeia archaeon]
MTIGGRACTRRGGKERRRILSVIGHKFLALEHIGSTAVPGLGAKPIDIMACVGVASDADECVPF